MMVANCIPSAVYVMDCGSGIVKVGRSKSPDHRRKTLQRGASRALKIMYLTEVRPDASLVESLAHEILERRRQRPDRERFRATPSLAIAAVQKAERLANRLSEASKPIHAVASSEAVQSLKLLAAEFETTRQEMMQEALNLLFAKYQKPQIA